jgi:hypothetical protein
MCGALEMSKDNIKELLLTKIQTCCSGYLMRWAEGVKLRDNLHQGLPYPSCVIKAVSIIPDLEKQRYKIDNIMFALENSRKRYFFWQAAQVL